MSGLDLENVVWFFLSLLRVTTHLGHFTYESTFLYCRLCQRQNKDRGGCWGSISTNGNNMILFLP